MKSNLSSLALAPRPGPGRPGGADSCPTRSLMRLASNISENHVSGQRVACQHKSATRVVRNSLMPSDFGRHLTTGIAAAQPCDSSPAAPRRQAAVALSSISRTESAYWKGTSMLRRRCLALALALARRADERRMQTSGSPAQMSCGLPCLRKRMKQRRTAAPAPS